MITEMGMRSPPAEFWQTVLFELYRTVVRNNQLGQVQSTEDGAMATFNEVIRRVDFTNCRVTPSEGEVQPNPDVIKLVEWMNVAMQFGNFLAVFRDIKMNVDPTDSGNKTDDDLK